MLQAFKHTDKLKQFSLIIFVQEPMQDVHFVIRLVYSDDAIFHINVKASHHNVRIWCGANSPHAINKHERDSPKVLCHIKDTGSWTI